MATVIPTKQHAWVKWSLTAMDVIVDPITGDCFAVESDEAVGEQVCCHSCGESLSAAAVSAPCEGAIVL